MAYEGNSMLKCKNGTIHSFVRLLICSLAPLVLGCAFILLLECLFGWFVSFSVSLSISLYLSLFLFFILKIESKNLKCAKCKNNYANQCSQLRLAFFYMCLSVCVKTWSQSCLRHKEAKAFTICCHTFNIYNYQTNTAAGYLLFSIQLIQTLRNSVSIFPSGHPFFLGVPCSFRLFTHPSHYYRLYRKRQMQTYNFTEPEQKLKLKHNTNLQRICTTRGESSLNMMCVAKHWLSNAGGASLTRFHRQHFLHICILV